MPNAQIQILPYQECYQQEIDLLMEGIAKEFSEPISTNRIAKSILPPDLYLVAIVENKLVGTISITRLENNNSVLRKMFLHKNYRGQGIAELLLQKIINWANSNEINLIYLGTMTQFTNAQKFYQKHYFQKVEKELLPNDFPINPIDSIFYKRNLTFEMNYRQGVTDDLKKLKELAINSWQQFQKELTDENWQTLYRNISNDQTFTDLLATSHCFVCETEDKEIVGMAFVVPSGKQHDIFEKEWAVIRFVTVNPILGGQGIGKRLTEMCIEWAKQSNEKTIALHTSEMMHSARHIYESYGFTILKEIEQRLGKKYWLYTLDIRN